MIFNYNLVAIIVNFDNIEILAYSLYIVTLSKHQGNRLNVYNIDKLT